MDPPDKLEDDELKDIQTINNPRLIGIIFLTFKGRPS